MTEPKLSLISFETPDHLTLPGLLYEPTRVTERVAINLHGNGSSSVFYSQDSNIYGRILTENGISFFTFNNRGAHYIKALHRLVEGKDERIRYGTAYELIKECILDIDGALSYLQDKGYRTFYLIGHSTGANKICVYNYYKPKNVVSKYVLLGGGDDTGLYYQMMGPKKFSLAIKRSLSEIRKGNGRKLVPKFLAGEAIISFQSLYDTINPNGDYNIFPFNESLNELGLSTKPLFREYKSINKPSLVIYGEFDEYCYGVVSQCVAVLKKESKTIANFTFHIFPEANHGFDGKEAELAKLISEWL